jgi:hypothetical protein
MKGKEESTAAGFDVESTPAEDVKNFFLGCNQDLRYLRADRGNQRLEPRGQAKLAEQVLVRRHWFSISSEPSQCASSLGGESCNEWKRARRGVRNLALTRGGRPSTLWAARPK